MKPTNKAPKPNKKVRPTKQECSICTESKATCRFRAPKDACEHFKTICTICAQEMLKTRIAERQLDRVELTCPFDNCAHEMDYPTLKSMVTKPAFVA